MTLLTTFGYFRMWMVAAIVMWMHLSCGIGLLTTQGRERHQLAVNMAIGVPVILVLVVLVFLVSDGPLF
jgi:Kef-type K+ transport system membrane component KefB